MYPARVLVLMWLFTMLYKAAPHKAVYLVSIKLKILPVIKLQQVKSRYLPIVPLCVIFSMCWRLKHHYLVWLTRYHILDRNHCCENCSPFPKPQNNLTIFFYSKKKWKYWYFSLIFEVSKIRCRLITVWGSTTMCLDGGALSSCECRRVVSVLTVVLHVLCQSL